MAGSVLGWLHTGYRASDVQPAAEAGPRTDTRGGKRLPYAWKPCLRSTEHLDQMP